MLDKPYELDTEVVSEAIATAEILTIFFPWLDHALIFDTRHTATVPPAIFTDGMVGSAEERLRSIAQARPHLSPPDQLTALPWPGGVTSFQDSGAYEQVVRRCYHLGHGELESNCRRALAELQRAEHQIKLAYVRGDNSRTLYQRPRR